MGISDRHHVEWLTGALGDARYFYGHVRKFNLFLLTVLSPVGK